MKKLLFLLLLPVLCIGQDTTSLDPHRFEPPLEWFDTVQKGYWQITVDGDTLPSRFDRFDTAHHEAMELAESYAPLDDYPVIRIIPPYWEADYRFNHAIIDALRSISVVPQEYSLLKNVRWHHEIDSAKAMHKITIQGESDADWVRFRFAGQDRAQRPDSSFSTSFWTDSLETLPLEVQAVQLNQTAPNWQITWTDSVHLGMIDTLGGTASIRDLKKKGSEMPFPDPVDRLEFEIPRDSTDVTLDWSDTGSNNEVNGTSMSVNAGEMILILGGAEAQHPDVSTPTNYTELFNIAVHSDNGSHYAFYKEASGGETSVTISRSSNTTLAIHVARIQSWNSIEAATTQGFGSGVNAPSLSPTFSTPADILWYITLGLSDDNEIPSAAPTNYSTNLVTTLNPSGSSNLYQTFSSSWRKNNASSEDPDSWSNPSQWYGAATIAVEPGSKGTPGTTLTPDSLSHNHTLESPAIESNYALTPNSLQHGHALESPTFLSKYTLSANGLQHGHSLESPVFASTYTLSANGLQHGHALQQSSLSVAFTLQPNSLSHGHSLEQPVFTVNYGLTPNGLHHRHSLESPTAVPAYVFLPNRLSHNHTLESTAINALYNLSANDLQHGHSLDSPATVPGYVFSPNGLQHNHTLQATSISEAILLAPDNLTHSHTLEASRLEASYLLSASDLNHNHSLETAGLVVAYGLSPQPLQHGHTLETSVATVNYLIAPESLSHAHSLEQAGLVPHYLFTPEDLQHNHALDQAVLQTIGKATKLQLSANELYAINLQAKKLYKVSLATIEDAQDLNVNDLYTITTSVKSKYVITLNANEKIE